MLYYITWTRVMVASRVRLRANPAHCTTMTASFDHRRAVWMETTRRFKVGSSGKCTQVPDHCDRVSAFYATWFGLKRRKPPRHSPPTPTMEAERRGVSLVRPSRPWLLRVFEMIRLGNWVTGAVRFDAMHNQDVQPTGLSRRREVNVQ